MSIDLKICPKCEEQMILGFLLDQGFLQSTVNLWYEGRPEKDTSGKIIQPSMDTCVPTVAFRCRDCGYLEFYAGEEYIPD